MELALTHCIHSLAIFGCLLGYELIAMRVKDGIERSIERIGHE